MHFLPFCHKVSIGVSSLYCFIHVIYTLLSYSQWCVEYGLQRPNFQAILVLHQYCFTCLLELLFEVCRKYFLMCVEDGPQVPNYEAIFDLPNMSKFSCFFLLSKKELALVSHQSLVMYSIDIGAALRGVLNMGLMCLIFRSVWSPKGPISWPTVKFGAEFIRSSGLLFSFSDFLPFFN